MKLNSVDCVKNVWLSRKVQSKFSEFMLVWTAEEVGAHCPPCLWVGPHWDIFWHQRQDRTTNMGIPAVSDTLSGEANLGPPEDNSSNWLYD